MAIKTDYSVLGFGNPFCDRSTAVDDAFLQGHQLEKGGTAVTHDRSAINASWADATQKTDSDFQWSLGGSGTNVIKTLAHLGNRCALFGKIGSEEIGQKITERLKQTGVTTLLSQGTHDAGIVNCFITPDSQRTMHAYLGASIELSERDLSVDQFQNVQHVHFEGYSAYFGKVLETGISMAKQHHASISLDLASLNVVEQFKPRLEESASRVNFLFGNTQEMLALTGCEAIQEALESFDSSQEVVATDGSKGCWVKATGKTDAVHYAALEVAGVRDTAGAGDFFDAGYIHGALRGKPVSQCVHMGNLAASFVIREEGAELPQDKWAELKDLVRKV